MPQVWSWILSVGSLIAFWLVGSGKRSGWLINLMLQSVWVIYSVTTQQWGFLISTVLFSIVYVRNWTKK